MPERIDIDLSEIVGQITSVFLEPYAAFIAKLRAEGRITDVEVEELNKEIKDRGPRLHELIVAQQSQDLEEVSPPPGPGPQSPV